MSTPSNTTGNNQMSALCGSSADRTVWIRSVPLCRDAHGVASRAHGVALGDSHGVESSQIARCGSGPFFRPVKGARLRSRSGLVIGVSDVDCCVDCRNSGGVSGDGSVLETQDAVKNSENGFCRCLEID